MTRILVIQLCRLGDMLQTTPMLRGLRRAHPGARITLMVFDGFSHTPVPRALYDELAVFPLRSLGESVRTDWTAARRELRAFLDSLGTEPFDLVLNLTGSPTANLLSARVRAREVRGALIAPDRTRVVRHPWMAYFWASQLARTYGCINLVDLFQWTAGVPIDDGRLEIDVPVEARTKMEAWLRTRGWTGEPLIALQLGASDERKRWPPERVAAMANLLPASAGTMVFVGSASERPLVGRALARLDRPAIDAAGETSVPELAALLGHARLLVTNDTGTMHVAVAVGTRVLDLSTGPVFVHETGPYAAGSVAVEPTAACFPCAAGASCHQLTCRDDLNEAEIAGLARFALGDGPLVRPARARVLVAERTATGRIEYRPVWEPAGRRQSIERRALARMWETTMPVPGVPAPDGLALEELALDDRDLIGALERFAVRADRAAAIARRIDGANRAAETHATELGRAFEVAHTAATVTPILLPVVAYLRTRLESAAGHDVRSLAHFYREEWAMAARRARLLARIFSGRAAATAAS
ncbi:MAG TPA: glycosyltransferase family 9 protein [Vicinamibacterales bacterium]